MAGDDIEEMRGCQWTELKKSMDKEYVNQLEDKARRQETQTSPIFCSTPLQISSLILISGPQTVGTGT